MEAWSPLEIVFYGGFCAVLFVSAWGLNRLAGQSESKMARRVFLWVSGLFPSLFLGGFILFMITKGAWPDMILWGLFAFSPPFSAVTLIGAWLGQRSARRQAAG